MYRDRTMAGTKESPTHVQNSIIIIVLQCSHICNCRLLPTLNFITLIIFSYPGQAKTSTAALRLTEGSVNARGRKPQKQITWSSRLGVMQRASYPSMENFPKLKILNEGTEQDGLMDVDESEYKGI